MSEVAQPDQSQIHSVRIGARLVVDLLRLDLDEPLTDKLTLSPQRSRHALALLKDKLYQIQKTVSMVDMQYSVVGALVERCSEMEVSLPIAEPDWGCILLIDRLFDTLLEEHGLDSDAQAWFSQLRLPVARYALEDYSFFFAQQNLVRRFLNQAYLSLLSSTEKSRKVNRDQLNQYSKRIFDGFESDISEFNSICIEAQAWFAGQNQKVEKIEQQLKSLETARRKEKVAEPRVVEVLNRIAAGKNMPILLTHFLHGEWRKSLMLISMREGDQGSVWKRQVRVTESLIEFAEGCSDDSQREKYRSFYPVLMKNLRALLVSVEGEAELADVLEPLELVFSAMQSGAIPDREKVPRLNVSNPFVTTVEISQVGQQSLDAIENLTEGELLRMKTGDGSHELCRVTLKGSVNEAWVLVSQSGKTVAKKNSLQLAQAIDGGVLDIIHQSQYWDHALESHFQSKYLQWIQRRKKQQEEIAQQKKEQAISLQNRAEDEQERKDQELKSYESRTEEILKESTLELERIVEVDKTLELDQVTEGSGSESTDDFLPARTISEQEMEVALQAVEKIQVGGWIAQETSEGEQRCKLAVKIRGHNKLVFVNRVGIKVLETSREELAQLIAFGAVIIVDTGTEFDNTLERVVRGIQKDRG